MYYSETFIYGYPATCSRTPIDVPRSHILVKINLCKRVTPLLSKEFLVISDKKGFALFRKIL